MERKNKACWNCKYFGALYKKGPIHFSKTKIGTCTIKKDIVDKSGLCERWGNTFALRSDRRKITLRALNDIITEIAAIRQILEEDEEASRTHPGHMDL